MTVDQSAKYNSIQELKSSSKPADQSSVISSERYDSFECSMKALRQEYINQLKLVMNPEI